MYKVANSVDWTKIESLHSMDGTLPVNDDVNAAVYSAQMVECNARKAEALVIQNPVDPLLAVRSLLFRGRLNDAREMIDALRKQNHFDPETYAKFLVEEARLAVFRGDWIHCLRLCDQCLANELPAVTRLATLQLRALAHFELGSFSKSRADLVMVDSLASLFPKSISVFYAMILALRIDARERGVVQAQAVLREMWSGWLTEGGDIDQLQTLLRTEVDLKRLSGHDHFMFAVASYAVAEFMGEGLYAALAALDCAVASAGADQVYFDGWLAQLDQSFERIATLQGELRNEKMRSTSAKTMAAFIKENLGRGSSRVFSVDLLNAKQLALTSQQIVVNLNPFRVTSLKRHAQLISVIETLAQGPISKIDFFKKTWGNQKYAPELHDNLIYAVLHRLKKIADVKAAVRDGTICLENLLIVT